MSKEKYIPPTYAELVRQVDELDVMYNAKKQETEYWKSLHAAYVEESIYKSNNYD